MWEQYFYFINMVTNHSGFTRNKMGGRLPDGNTGMRLS